MKPLTGRQELLRYAIASMPLLFFGAGWIFLIAQGIAEWPAAVLDIGLGVVGLILLRWRRRFPFLIAVITALLTLQSSSAIGPACVALVSLATHRHWLRIAGASAVFWAAFLITSLVNTGWEAPTLIAAGWGALSIGLLVGFGLFLGSTRDLALSESRRQESERRDGLEHARAAERARLAREMHDVLAHRLSLLSLHAGALAHRNDLSSEEVRQAAAIIRDNAHASLEELRSTLGSLRQEDTLGLPQPSFDDLPALIAEVSEAGQGVTYSADVEHLDQLPPQVGRHIFRIVQEALTNARKHAPGAPVTVVIAGSPGASINIRVTNATTSFGPPQLASGGLGLIGLGERAALLGGTLRSRFEGGQFILDASLPWGSAS